MPLRSVGGVLISLPVAIEPVGGWTTKAYITIAIRLRYDYETTIPRRIRGIVVSYVESQL